MSRVERFLLYTLYGSPTKKAIKKLFDRLMNIYAHYFIIQTGLIDLQMPMVRIKVRYRASPALLSDVPLFHGKRIKKSRKWYCIACTPCDGFDATRC